MNPGRPPKTAVFTSPVHFLSPSSFDFVDDQMRPHVHTTGSAERFFHASSFFCPGFTNNYQTSFILSLIFFNHHLPLLLLLFTVLTSRIGNIKRRAQVMTNTVHLAQGPCACRSVCQPISSRSSRCSFAVLPGHKDWRILSLIFHTDERCNKIKK